MNQDEAQAKLDTVTKVEGEITKGISEMQENEGALSASEKWAFRQGFLTGAQYAIEVSRETFKEVANA